MLLFNPSSYDPAFLDENSRAAMTDLVVSTGLSVAQFLAKQAASGIANVARKAAAGKLEGFAWWAAGELRF